MYIFVKLREALDSMRTVMQDSEITQGERLISQFESVSSAFFKLLSLVKVTIHIDVKETPAIEACILNLSSKYRQFIPGPITTKFHLLEAHLLEFIYMYRCTWPYAEEGVESAHHWIRLFREKTSYVTGWKRKYEGFAAAWTANQSLLGHKELESAMDRGRKHKFAKRRRNKIELSQLIVNY